jgi:hypothetical protein
MIQLNVNGAKQSLKCRHHGLLFTADFSASAPRGAQFSAVGLFPGPESSTLDKVKRNLGGQS